MSDAGYSMSDLFGGPSTTTTLPSSPPSGGGGYSMSDLFGGSSGPSSAGDSAGPTAPTAAPAAAPKSKGGGGGGGIFGPLSRAITGHLAGPTGGGVFGSLGRAAASAANFVNPIHTVTTVIPGLAEAGLTDVAHLGEAAVGRGPFGSIVAGEAPSHPGETLPAFLQQQLPLTGGILHGVQQTARYGAGGVQAAAGVGQGGQGLLGRGLQHETARQFADNPFNATLNVAGTAALVAGPLAAAAGAGAAGADAAAAEAEAEAASMGRLAAQGAASPADAAAAAQRASMLRQAATVAQNSPAARLAQATGKAGEAGRAVMEAPFRPLGIAVRGGELGPLSTGGLAGFARNLAGPAEDAGPVSGLLGRARIPGAGVTVGEQAARAAQVGDARSILRAGIDTLRQRQGQNLQYQRDAAAASGADPEVVQAAVSREAGRAGGAQVALAAQAHGIALPADLPTERTALLTAGQGNPEEEARVTATAAVLRAQAAARSAEEQAGVGRVTGPLNAEQAGMMPLTRNVAAQLAPLEEAAARTRSQLADLQPKLDRAQAQRVYTPAELADLRSTFGRAYDEAETAARDLVASDPARAAAAAGIRTTLLPDPETIVQRLTAEILRGQHGTTNPALADIAYRSAEAGPVVPAEVGRLAAAARQAGETGGRQAVVSRLGDEAAAMRSRGETLAGVTARPAVPLAPDVTAGFEEAVGRARNAAEAAAQAKTAGGQAEDQIYRDTQTAHAVEEVKAGRAAYRTAAQQEYRRLSGEMEAFTEAGHVIPESDALKAKTEARLPVRSLPEYDDMREASRPVKAMLHGSGVDRLPPDVWLRQVQHLLAGGPDSTLADAVAHLEGLQRERAVMGRAASAAPSAEDVRLAAVRRVASSGEADYIDALFRGSPAEAAQALAEHLDVGGPQAAARLAEAYQRVDDYLKAKTEPADTLAHHVALTPLEQQIADAELARYRAARAAGGVDSARAELIGRLTRYGREQGRLEARPAAVGGVLVSVAKTLERIARQEAPAAAPADMGAAQRAAVAGMAKPYEAGIRLGKIEQRAAVLERLRASAQGRLSRQEDAVTAEQAKAEANPANAPARARPALLANIAQAKAIGEAADAADKIQPGAGSQVRALGDGLDTTLAELRAHGVDPTHFTGPRQPAEPARGGGREQLPRVAKLASERQKVAGVLPSGLGDIRSTEDARARQVVANETAKTLAARMAPNADQRGLTIVDGRAPKGLVGYNPATIFQNVADGQVTQSTPLMPKAVFDTFRHTFGPSTPGIGARMWDSAIRAGKDVGVAFSPAYWASVVLADSLKVGVLAEPGPLAVIRAVPGALDIIRNDAGNPLAAAAGRGLSSEQGEMLNLHPGDTPAGGLLHRAAAPFWKGTDFVQNVQRLSVALAAEAKGASPEEAVAEARRVAGVFDNLTKTEQQARRVVPGYAFYKHISTLALKLPFDSPARMAWLGYLYSQVGPQKPPPGFLNPGGILEGLPSFAPPIRYGAALAGLHLTTNLNTLGGETSPQTSPGRGGHAAILTHGNAAPGEAAYVASQLFAPTRGLVAAAEPNVHRYQTGEPTKTATPYPGGRLAGVAYGLGLTPPTPAPASTSTSTSSGRATSVLSRSRGGRSASRGRRR